MYPIDRRFGLHQTAMALVIVCSRPSPRLRRWRQRARGKNSSKKPKGAWTKTWAQWGPQIRGCTRSARQYSQSGRDEWAAAWSAIAERYDKRAKMKRRAKTTARRETTTSGVPLLHCGALARAELIGKQKPI